MNSITWCFGARVRMNMGGLPKSVDDYCEQTSIGLCILALLLGVLLGEGGIYRFVRLSFLS